MRDSSWDWFVQPSFTSFACSVILSVGIMAVAIIADIFKNGLVYNLLFGAASSAVQIETAQNTVRGVTDSILGNSTLNKVLFFGFWLMIGLIVYTIVVSFSYYTGGIISFWEELHQVNSRKKLLREQFRLRLLLQAIGLLLLVFFSLFFVKTLLPFSVLCARISVGLWGTLAGIGYFLAGFVTLLLSFHLYAMLLRFAALRSRVFGNVLE